MVSSNIDELIARYIEENPNRRGPADARLRDEGTAVWALISYLQAVAQGDLQATAEAYGISTEAMQAALAYYEQHQEPINARIAWNAA
jgi:uncharacterized protein (DUF433 family)